MTNPKSEYSQRLLFFRIYLTHESVQSDDFWGVRMVPSYYTTINAVQRASALRGNSCWVMPWWTIRPWTMVMRTKVLVQLDLKVGSATNETWFILFIHDSKTPLGPRSAKWRLWQFYAIFCWGNWFPLTGWIAWLWRPDRRVLVALGPTCCVGRSLLLALWRWLPCCRVWWVLPSHVWRCRKSLGGWWSSQGCSD